MSRPRRWRKPQRRRPARSRTSLPFARSHQRRGRGRRVGSFRGRDHARRRLPARKLGHTRIRSSVRSDTSPPRSSPACAPCSPRTARVTAGNATPLTDGAACSAAHERREGQGARLRRRSPPSSSWSYVGVDPERPAPHRPRARDAQGARPPRVWSCRTSTSSTCTKRSPRRSSASPRRSRARPSRRRASAAVEEGRQRSTSDSFNVHGGSIAIGHPFGATGARMVTTMANELRLRNAETALLGICAAGGLGAAAVLERV